MAKVRILFQLLSVFPKKMQKSYESNWRKVAQKSVFLKKSREKWLFFDKKRGKSSSLSEDFDQFSDLGDAAFWFHLTDYQEIVIYGMKAVWSFWSFGHLSKSKTDAVKIITIIKKYIFIL